MNKDRTLEIPMKIESFAISDQGTREYQQDAGYVEVQGSMGVAVLCDGMGGLEGGEKASSMGINLFMRDFKENWPIQDIPSFLQSEALLIDRSIHRMEDEKGVPLHAGTTMVSTVIVGSRLYWLSVGDSRLYIVRDGEMTCLTKEHNYKTLLREQLEAGLIDLNYYNMEINQGEALTSYLGMGNISLIDTNQPAFELWKEDILLLCSDGLYKTLNDEQIQALVNESGSHLDFAGQRLIDMARRLGINGRDNTTLILLKLTDR